MRQIGMASFRLWKKENVNHHEYFYKLGLVPYENKTKVVDKSIMDNFCFSVLLEFDKFLQISCDIPLERDVPINDCSSLFDALANSFFFSSSSLDTSASREYVLRRLFELFFDSGVLPLLDPFWPEFESILSFLFSSVNFEPK